MSERAADEITVVAANRAAWEDISSIFGNRGMGQVCWCQRYKLERGESFASVPSDERAFRMREQTDAGHPEAPDTSGLVAYLGPEPVGWCAVEPRPAYFGLVRNARVPWEGRREDPTDTAVWAVTCLFTRAGFRRLGVARAMAAAAVGHARQRGAHALEAYPMTTTGVITEELHVGTVGMFAAAGFKEVGRPTSRRAVMRIELG